MDENQKTAPNFFQISTSGIYFPIDFYLFMLCNFYCSLLLPFQAFRCSLAQIKSDSTKGWNPSAKKFFEKCLEASPVKVLKMHVEGRDKNTIKVLLFASNVEKEICFNSMLVEHKYAKGTGPRFVLRA